MRSLLFGSLSLFCALLCACHPQPTPASDKLPIPASEKTQPAPGSPKTTASVSVLSPSAALARVEGAPEVERWRRSLASTLVLMVEGRDSTGAWSVAAMEDHPTHTCRLETFRVSESGHMSVWDFSADEFVAMSAWSRRH